MIKKHIHKIGIFCKCYSGQQHFKFRCQICGLYFGGQEVIFYLDRHLGDDEGIKYWRKLRYLQDEMKINRRRGAEFEGFFMP